MADKELFGQPLHDIGATIPILPDATKRKAFADIGQSGAQNVTWPVEKSIILAQGADRAAAEYVDANDNSDMFLTSVGEDIKLIDRSRIAAGGYVSMAVESGVKIIHNFDKTTIPLAERPANYDNLCSILLSTENDYTTSKVIEPFDFRLVYRAGDFVFVDWSRGTTVGSVDPDDYVAALAAYGGAEVDAASKIVGFDFADLDGAVVVKGSAGTYQINTSTLDITFVGLVGTGVVTTVVTATGRVIDFATTQPFGIEADTGLRFPVLVWLSSSEADGATYQQHERGALEIDGVYIVNNSSGEAIL